MFLPGIYRTQHTASMVDILGRPAAQGPMSAGSYGVLDWAWWAHLEAYSYAIGDVWAAASVLLLAWGLVTILRAWWIVAASQRGIRRSGSTAIVDGVPVVVTDSMGPATVGLWKVRVLVPRWVLALPRAQRQYVLRHEDEHRRAKDARLLFFASLTLVLAPWNLSMWWLLRRLRLAVEMDCDNRVVSALGDPNAYGALLLKVAEASSRGPRLQPAFLGGMGMLERRLTGLVAPSPLRHMQRFLVPAAAIALLILMLSLPHPVLGDQPHDHATMTSAETR